MIKFNIWWEETTLQTMHYWSFRPPTKKIKDLEVGCVIKYQKSGEAQKTPTTKCDRI